jgi:CRISPR-associated protein Cas1
MELCWEHGVAVNYLSETGYFLARVTGVHDTSVTLRRAQFRAARESEISDHKSQISKATDDLARSLRELDGVRQLDAVRGSEGLAAQVYFSAFTFMLKQQRDDFAFTSRSRRPPRDMINCLLSFLYALVRHDCIAALTSVCLDPFVGFLHTDRPNRPSHAIDLMEEFRPWLADRLAITLINLQQIQSSHFKKREGGAVEFADDGRKLVIRAYQERKQESITHPFLDQTLRIGQLSFIQARVLTRHLRGDMTDYLPLVPK